MKGRKFIVSMGIAFLFVFALTSVVWAGNAVNLFPNQHTAINYLHSVQNDDGGFPARPGGNSDRSVTAWVIMALAAAGEDVTGSGWTPANHNPVDFLNNCQEPLTSTCDYARMLMALAAAGRGTDYRGVDLAEKIASFQLSSGQFAQPSQQEQEFVNSHMWSILALASSGKDIPNKEQAKKWLLARQNEDGGFSWAGGVSSDSDDTGVALRTLVLLGEDPHSSSAIKNALQYLKSCQEEDGGFNSGWMGAKSNCATDAWVLWGLFAAGENPENEEWSISGNNAVKHLLSLQNSDGSFNWTADVKSSPVMMTAYAILALVENSIMKSPVSFPVVGEGPLTCNNAD